MPTTPLDSRMQPKGLGRRLFAGGLLASALLAAGFLSSRGGGAEAAGDEDALEVIRRSIYKIEVVAQSPDFIRPWVYDNEVQAMGTGFYIGQGRILTNAHVVANGRF